MNEWAHLDNAIFDIVLNPLILIIILLLLLFFLIHSLSTFYSLFSETRSNTISQTLWSKMQNPHWPTISSSRRWQICDVSANKCSLGKCCLIRGRELHLCLISLYFVQYFRQNDMLLYLMGKNELLFLIIPINFMDKLLFCVFLFFSGCLGKGILIIWLTGQLWQYYYTILSWG